MSTSRAQDLHNHRQCNCMAASQIACTGCQRSKKCHGQMHLSCQHTGRQTLYLVIFWIFHLVFSGLVHFGRMLPQSEKPFGPKLQTLREIPSTLCTCSSSNNKPNLRPWSMHRVVDHGLASQKHSAPPQLASYA